MSPLPLKMHVFWEKRWFNCPHHILKFGAKIHQATTKMTLTSHQKKAMKLSWKIQEFEGSANLYSCFINTKYNKLKVNIYYV